MVCIGTKGYRLVLHHPRQFFSGQWTSFVKHVAAIQGDILITGKDDGQHIQNLSTVLSRLDSYGLRLQLGKCKFMQRSVTYMGCVISALGI